MKFVGLCFQADMYPVAGDFCNTTIWRGKGVTWIMDLIQLMNISLSEVEIVTDLSPSNITLPLIQTIADGRADTVPIALGMSHSRYKLVDFTGPTYFSDTKIFSKKRPAELMANFLSKTFDLPSFAMVMVSTMIISFVIWISQKGSNHHVPLGSCVLYTIGNCLAQGVPNILQNGINGRLKMILGIHGLLIVVLYKSFSGTITASILSQKAPKQIDSLWDVAKYPSLKIISESGTFWHADLMSHPATALIENRIEKRSLFGFDPSDVKKVLDDLYRGTHVLNGHGSFLKQILEVSDEYSLDKFHHSDPIMSRPVAVGFSKNSSETTRKIATGVDWLVAFGLYEKDISREFIQYHQEDCSFAGPKSCPRPTEDEKSSILAKKRRLQASWKNSENRTLTLKHFKIIFYILILGLSLSLLLFMFEAIIFFCSSQNKY